MCSAKHMEKLSVRTEGQGLSILWNDVLIFKTGEIGVDTFYLKTLGIVKTMKQTTRDSV